MILKKLLKSIKSIFKQVVYINSDYIPEYKTDGSACFDFISTSSHTYKQFELFNLGTGVRCEIPKGWCMLVFARSSLGQKKLIIPNSVGVIDSDYRGEIKVPLISLNNEDVTIKEGQRVAQGLLVKVNKAYFEMSDKLEATTRGDGGFGSTGL